MFGRGSVSAQPELGIEGAEEDVSDVERPKWTLFENGLELGFDKLRQVAPANGFLSGV